MIFIRLVDGGINDDNRFEIAFKNIPNDKWKTFSNANELPQKLYEEINNNAITLSFSLFYKILPILLSLVYHFFMR
jgi:hypothetical protein